MLSAEEARQLVVKARREIANNKVVLRHIASIEKRIRTAASNGYRNIKGPFFKHLSPTILAEIEKKIESHGYEWIPGGYEDDFPPPLLAIEDEALRVWISDLMSDARTYKPRKDEIRW